MADKESKEIAVKKAADLPALPTLPNLQELREVFEANFEGITPTFETIKIPTGGALAWAVPGDGDEPDYEKEIQGVILDHYGCRVFWEQKYGGSGAGGPPDCSSVDGKTGSKYGDCSKCKWSQWGTATKADGTPSRGQACKMIHRVYLWMAGKDSIFPYLLPLPPTSGQSKYDGSLQTYAVKMGAKLKKLHDVRTKLKLVADTNADGTKYAKAQFFFVGDLTAEEKAQAAFLREQLRPAMRAKPFEVDEDNAPSMANVETGAGLDPWEHGG